MRRDPTTAGAGELTEEALSLGDVAKATGVPGTTIRAWETRYGWPSPARTAGRHRRYSAEDLRRLVALRNEIARGRNAGEAVEMLRAIDERRVHPYTDEIVAGAIALDPRPVRAALHEAARDLGVVKTVEDVAVIALREIGDHWAVGTCDVAGEHLGTGEIRRWFNEVAARGADATSGPPVVLACGPDELHTGGLEAFQVLLVERGVAALFLGAQTPPDSFAMTVRDTGADAAVMLCHRPQARRGSLVALRLLAGIRGARVYYAGNGFAAARARRSVPGKYLGTDLSAAADLVANERTS
ncbi:MAG TPA: MerR family transcriptional regulator [Actinomycetota bacterium]|nr:MerR family transcriptional regulator [Actinomycetota bacterium]